MSSACTAPRSSEAVVRTLDATLQLADGVRLASRLWLPDGEGPWPVLVMRQPYGRAIASTVTYAHPSWYAGHGFLVVVQDVRGRGDSDGGFAGFAQEAADGAATIRWARALEGSNGRVGTYGFSYQGLSQLLNSAVDDDAALPDCLSPAMCGLDERLHWASEGGAHWWALGLGWA
ncbi:CocE/NonD family hydrolase, partial [Cyanobium gracile]